MSSGWYSLGLTLIGLILILVALIGVTVWLDRKQERHARKYRERDDQ